MDKRHRFKQTQSLQERIADEARRLRDGAKLLPPGALREEVLRRAGQAEAYSRACEWLRSPALQPPNYDNRVKPPPCGSLERVGLNEERRRDAEQAVIEHKQAEEAFRANYERLKAERLAKEEPAKK
jgi:hypothetical protein